MTWAKTRIVPVSNKLVRAVKKVQRAWRRRGRNPRSRGASGVMKVDKYHGTVFKFNNFKQGQYRLSRTVNSTLNYSAGASSPSAGFSFIFDPSGTYNNHGVAGAPVAMPDWSNLIACFDQYKVNKIKVRTFVTTTGNLDTDPCIILHRYNYEASVTGPTLNGMEQLPGTIQKTYTSQSPEFQYTIYPKVQMVTYNSGLLAQEGRELVKQKWTDCTFPVQILGYSFFLFNGTTASQTVNFEVEYDLSFRYNK